MALRRREWLKTIGAAGFGAVGSQLFERAHAESTQTTNQQPLALKDYEPKSMLHVPVTHVPRSRFPNIDFHSHLSWVDRKGKSDVVNHLATPAEILSVMDAKNVRIMVNLTGGYGPLLEETVRHWQQPHPDRFIVFTEPWYAKITLPNYSKFQAQQLEAAGIFATAGTGPAVVRRAGTAYRCRPRRAAPRPYRWIPS